MRSFLKGKLIISRKGVKDTVLLAAADVAAGSCFFAFNPGLYYVSGTTDAGGHTKGLCRAVGGTGPAFDAIIFFNHLCFFVRHSKYTMRANQGAYAAADTCIDIECQCGNTAKIFEMVHLGHLHKCRPYPGNNSNQQCCDLQRYGCSHLLLNSGR